MTVEELKSHLRTHTLYVLRRELTHRNYPKKVSFVVVVGQELHVVDLAVQYLLREDGATLSPFGEEKVVHLFNRWVQTTEQWVNLLSDRLYHESSKVAFLEL